MHKNGSRTQTKNGPGATSKPSNVIDLRTRKRITGKPVENSGKNSKVRGSETTSSHVSENKFDSLAENTSVVDMTERRNKILVDERRQVRRTIFTEFIGAFVVIPNQGLHKVNIYDLSEKGISFDIEQGGSQLDVSDKLAMRIYLNRQTYFPFAVQVMNSRQVLEESVWRYGASFIEGSMNSEALRHLVKFVETVCASLQTDHGDVMVSNLRR